MIIPFVHKVGLVGQQVNVPVESLEVTDEVVVDVTRRALLEEGGPVLVIVADIPVQEEVNKLGEAGILERGARDLLLPVVHHHPPPVLVVVVLVELSSLHARVLQLVSEGAKNSLKRMTNKDESFASFCELWIHVP